MRHLLVATCLAAASAVAAPKLTHARLVEKYEEPAIWSNRSNFYFGARGAVAIPQGAAGLASMAGVEMGIAPDYGFGMGLNVIWMERSPGAPMFGIQPGRFGFGASANLRYYIQTVGPLTLYPVASLGFLAGPDAAGLNQVLPLLNPGFGAKVKAGSFYVSFDFGLSGFTIPFIGISVGYEGDRRRDRAEAWATEKETRAREAAEEREAEQAPQAPESSNEPSTPPPPPSSAVPPVAQGGLPLAAR